MYEGPLWLYGATMVMKIAYVEPVSIEEIVESYDSASAMLDAVNNHVQLIIDLLGLRSMPPQLIASFPRLNNHPLTNHPNLDRVVVVIDNAFLEAVVSIFSRLYHKLNFVRTLDEAYRVVSVEHSIR